MYLLKLYIKKTETEAFITRVRAW